MWAMSRHEDTLVTVSQDKTVSYGGGGGVGVLGVGVQGNVLRQFLPMRVQCGPCLDMRIL